ncbi:microfibril-associated glycoprotein 4 isoform X1 [Astyanax mexicanus]|uniref:microfibril-associated glycoprotein 4 isoform X1 n=1 Tax=Astyanax mexicanus TaxID=7994 RepID=UPI0020CAA152|nr:microfibril-associated glycoprotein 4 isoform X1 [Astyanax mexicanus]
MKVFTALLFLLPIAAQSQYLRPEYCADIRKHDQTLPSGVYTIYPTATLILQVYCDMETDNGGWTVFQRRMDGSVNFYRGWDHYKTGFGFADGEYWLGLENLFHLTLRKKYELRVDMQDWDGGWASAQYSSFSVDPESYGYTLHVNGFIDGGAGDSLEYHNGQKFTTFDRDQDAASHYNCAARHRSAFWFQACQKSNPNGLYLWGHDDSASRTGVLWSHWKGHDYSLKFISMRIRPVSSAV